MKHYILAVLMAVASLTVGAQRHYEYPQTKRGERIVVHTGYALTYNNQTNCPNWVAWEMTKDEAEATGQRSDDFLPDPVIPKRYRVTTNDYKGSGYDRGHMCPAADMKWSAAAQKECFYMSNMCPQLHSLNAGCWAKLEDACRRWAKQEGSVYIVAGPVFRKGRKARYIGSAHKVRVPDGFYKAILSLKKGEEKAIAFYYTHDDQKQTMESQAMSVDALEKMTGYDFFYQVNDKIEKRVEANYNLTIWK